MQIQPEMDTPLMSVLRFMDELDSLIENGVTVPLTNQKIVDEDTFFVVTQRLRNALPEALKAAEVNVSKNENGTNSASISRLHRDDVTLLIVDVQQRLMPVIFEAERVEKNCVLLARAAQQLGVPVLITEQNPRHLGKTSNAICEVVGESPVLEKMSFSACTEDVLHAIENSERQTVLICGAESHVCVLQTALDLREKSYQVFAARDAISSRTFENAEIGWQRMMSAGVLPTSSESAIFEMLREAGTPEFRALLPLLK
jgi:nicotinamidase-related amidase